MQKLFILLLLLLANSAQAHLIRGIVLDKDNNGIAAASIYLKNSTYGVVSDARGQFIMELDNGEYIIVARCLGYETQELEVRITKNTRIEIKLEESITSLRQIDVTPGKKDPAYAILDSVRSKRSMFLSNSNGFKCAYYLKASIEKETTSRERDTLTGKRKKVLTKEKLNLIENSGDFYTNKRGEKKEVIAAWRNYSDKPQNTSFNESLASFGYYYEEEEPYEPQGDPSIFPLFFYLHPRSTPFNIY